MGAVFAAGGNGAERTLRRRQWGAHPPWKRPPAGAVSHAQSGDFPAKRPPPTPRRRTAKKEEFHMDLKINRETIPVTEILLDDMQEQSVELDYVLPD